MKKRISFLLAAALILAVLLPALPVLAEGENTFKADDANPTISTAADYLAFFKAVFNDKQDFAGKTVTMLKDITLNDTTAADWYTTASVKLTGSDVWKWFSGTFDGGNHTLKGAIPSGTFRGDAPFGIFPYANGAVIKNLVVDGFYVCSPNTSNDPTYGNAGIGGLIGHAKCNVTVDNVTMRNGIVTCVENGKGGIGAVIGTYDGQVSGQTLKITNCIVEETVQVTKGANSTAYIGGLIGYTMENFKSHPTTIDVTGSVIQPKGSMDAEATLKPYGWYNSPSTAGSHNWYVRNDATGYLEEINMKVDTYTDRYNQSIIASGCYGATAAPVVRLAGTQTRAADNAVRFVGMLKIPESLEDVSLLGFEVTVGNVTKGAGDIKCTKVYTSVLENGVQKNAPDGYYYFTFALTGVNAGTAFTVRACATVGEKVCTTTAATYTYTPAE